MKITCKLSNLDKAIKGVEEYQKRVLQKTQELNARLAEYGGYVAKTKFSSAMYAGDNDVEITVEPYDRGYKIIASGTAVLFIEFGTGTVNPEHPLGGQFGYLHGTYGKGQGNSTKYPKGWVYEGEQGNAGQPIRGRIGVYRTMGNPASRSMYDTGKDLRQELKRIAIEVFKNG